MNDLQGSKVMKLEDFLQSRLKDVPGNAALKNAVTSRTTRSEIKNISAQHLNFLGTFS